MCRWWVPSEPPLQNRLSRYIILLSHLPCYFNVIWPIRPNKYWTGRYSSSICPSHIDQVAILRKRACCGCGSRTSTVHESDSAEVEQRGGTTEATLSRKSFNYPLNVLSVNHTFRTIVRVERDWGLFDAIYCKESCGFITASTASDLDCDSCEMYC